MPIRVYAAAGVFRMSRAGSDAASADPQDRSKISFAENRPAIRIRAAGTVGSLPSGYPSSASQAFPETFPEPPTIFFGVSNEEYRASTNEPRGIIIGDWMSQYSAGGRAYVGTPYIGVVFTNQIVVTQATGFPYGLPAGNQFVYMALG